MDERRDDPVDALVASIFEPRSGRPAGAPFTASSLLALEKLVKITASLKGAERAWLLIARADGHSWREIGEALGIAPQLARERAHGRSRRRGVRG